MPSIIRKRKDAGPEYDPIAGAAWSAAAIATAKIAALVDLLRSADPSADRFLDALAEATKLTPCAYDPNARISPRPAWTFNDYVIGCTTFMGLRGIVDDMASLATPDIFDRYVETRADAMTALALFAEKLDDYEKVVKRARAVERITGRSSERRSLMAAVAATTRKDA